MAAQRGDTVWWLWRAALALCEEKPQGVRAAEGGGPGRGLCSVRGDRAPAQAQSVPGEK